MPTISSASTINYLTEVLTIACKLLISSLTTEHVSGILLTE